MNLQKVYVQNNPGRLIFGPKSVNELANELPADAVPLVVTDRGVAKSGILKRVTDVLEAKGVRHRVFDGIEPDPPVQVIEKAAALYRKSQCTMVIAVGGGSSI